MANVSFNNVKITAISTVVPPTVKYIDDEIDLYGGNESQIKRIKKSIGLDSRHVIGNDDVTTLDLCLSATENLFKLHHVDRESIDGLVFVTQTPDHFQPTNAAIVHGKLELSIDAACFDVSLGCSGYVYGLWLSHMMIQSGTCKNVLVLAGDTLSRCVNPRDRSAAPLFGDAGSATLVQRTDAPQKSYFSLHTDGSGFENIIQPAGAFRTPSNEQTKIVEVDGDGNSRSLEDLHMNGSEVFNFSIKREPEAIKQILEYSDFTIDEVDYVFFHQANQYIISNIVRRLKMPKEKAPSDIVGKYGNQSSASIPCAISYTLSKDEQKVEKPVILSGFGVGLSWASAIVDISGTVVTDVNIYQK